MRRLGKRLRTAVPAVLVFVACGPDRAGPPTRPGVDSPRELALDYETFDQRAGSGWRRIAEAGDFLGAAELVDRYGAERADLAEWQQLNLRFHAGQLYAFAGRTEPALARLKAALRAGEPVGSPVRWNAYVRATIAFLEWDRPRLAAYRAEIAAGPKLDGSVPNLDVVDRLIALSDEPYLVAYRGR
jgi:hypothetical protein